MSLDILNKYFSDIKYILIKDVLCICFDYLIKRTKEGLIFNEQKEGYWKENICDSISQGYYVFGKKEGEWNIYYSDGQLQVHENFINGIREGKYKVCSYWGETILEGTYINGKKEGKWFEWDNKDRGNDTWQNGTYINGKKEGVWKHFEFADNSTVYITYVNGKAIT